MTYSLSIGRIRSIILRNHKCLSQIRPVNLGSFSTNSHIAIRNKDMYAKNSILAYLYLCSIYVTYLVKYLICKKLKEY